MKKLVITILLLCLAIEINAQEINNYKYIIIPETFEFTGDKDEYRLNSLTKFLFEKNGFNTLMKTEEKPADLKAERCLGLETKLENNSGLFVTKFSLKLVDCNDKVVFETKEGRSREKDYQLAYQEALRDAFTSIEEIDYKYEASTTNNKSEIGTVVIPSVKEQFSEKAEEIEEEVETEKSEKALSPEVEDDPSESINSDSPSEVLEKTFQYSGENYNLKETSQGLGLFPANSSDPIAILIETNGGKSFIYNTLTNQGVAYFDVNGNLIVEFFDRQKNKKISLTYEVQN